VLDNATEDNCRRLRDRLLRQEVGRLAEQWHQLDPADTAFARLAIDHPEACHTAADYPGWIPGRR